MTEIISRQLRMAVPIANAGTFSSAINLLMGERVIDASEATSYGPTAADETHKGYAFPVAEAQVPAVVSAIAAAEGVYDTQRRFERESPGAPLTTWLNEAADVFTANGLVQYDPLAE